MSDEKHKEIDPKSRQERGRVNSEISKKDPKPAPHKGRGGQDPTSSSDDRVNRVKSETAKREEEILAFWKEHKIFEKSLEKPTKGEFVFYEGPPTANAMPGTHHLIARAFKDIILRYKTMQGYHVRRKAGWDTHGLPVEIAVEKEFKFLSKKDIEEYGVAKFNEKCKERVLKYIDEWGRFTERMGYWVDQKNAYFTYTPRSEERRVGKECRSR